MYKKNVKNRIFGQNNSTDAYECEYDYESDNT